MTHVQIFSTLIPRLMAMAALAALVSPWMSAPSVVAAEPPLQQEIASLQALHAATMGKKRFDEALDMLGWVFENQLKHDPELLESEVPIGYRDSKESFLRYARFWMSSHIETRRSVQVGAIYREFYFIDQYGVWKGLFPEPYIALYQGVGDIKGLVSFTHPMTHQTIYLNYLTGKYAGPLQDVQVRYGQFEDRTYTPVTVTLVTGPEADEHVNGALIDLIESRTKEAIEGKGIDMMPGMGHAILVCSRGRPEVRNASRIALRKLVDECKNRMMKSAIEEGMMKRIIEEGWDRYTNPALEKEIDCQRALQAAALGKKGFDEALDVLGWLYENQLKNNPELLKKEVPVGYRDSKESFLRYARFWMSSHVEPRRSVQVGATYQEFYFIDQYGVWKGLFPEPYTALAQGVEDFQGLVSFTHPMTHQTIHLNYLTGKYAGPLQDVQVRYGQFEDRTYTPVTVTLVTGHEADEHVNGALIDLIESRTKEAIEEKGRPDMLKAVAHAILLGVRTERSAVRNASSIAMRKIIDENKLRTADRRWAPPVVTTSELLPPLPPGMFSKSGSQQNP